jgi:beta-carotene 15,15'-dioxygenase
MVETILRTAGRTPATSASLVAATGPVVGTIVAIVAISLGDPAGTVPAWQLGLALAALVVGIPHGALDHLVAARVVDQVRWSVLVPAYLGSAAAASLLIVVLPAPGFAAVVVLTIVHFGSGDVAYAGRHAGDEPRSSLQTAGRIAVLGSVPVLLPLSHPASRAALAAINPELVDWVGPQLLTPARWATLGGVIWLAAGSVRRHHWFAVADLTSLTLLCLLAPPLVSFAVYFACWHTLRHTARLAALIEPARPELSGVLRVFLRGVPLAAATLVALVALRPHLTAVSALGGFLWTGLALVWGLTVPHMMLVLRLDRLDA